MNIPERPKIGCGCFIILFLINPLFLVIWAIIVAFRKLAWDRKYGHITEEEICEDEEDSDEEN